MVSGTIKADVCHIFDSIKNEPGDREEMKHSIFEGSAAAIVTPMDDYGNLIMKQWAGSLTGLWTGDGCGCC